MLKNFFPPKENRKPLKGSCFRKKKKKKKVTGTNVANRLGDS